ncbi:receptor-like kinase LIP2 [Coffea eugenioides]|uniref:receptor-like kinase LIP2 n=1 Tax=Coffea eugenioides TaxID=49369 RepID=UPI000F60C31B|nr:receptor-like kinase LIP2 [Coffea eugenioides]
MMEEEEESSQFLSELEKLRYEPYYYQEDNILKSPYFQPIHFLNPSSLFKEFKKKAEEFREINKIDGKDLDTVKYCDFSMLNEITDGFKKENFVQKALCGSLYRGNIRLGSRTQQVLVKTWDFYEIPGRTVDYPVYPSIFSAELNRLIQKELKGHDNLVNLIGYCFDKKLAVVYEAKADRVLSQELNSDNFDWDERMKVALQLAKFLEWLHDNHILLGALDASLILLDEEYNVALFELGLHRCVLDPSNGASTGVLKWIYSIFAPDPVVKDDSDLWTSKSEVFAYGCVLCQLIMKKYYQSNCSLSTIARSSFRENQASLVNEDFHVNAAAGYKITELARKCLQHDPVDRVDMRHVVNFLEQLTLDQKAKKQRTN